MIARLALLLMALPIVCQIATAQPQPAPRGLPQPMAPLPFGVNIHFVVPNETEVDQLAAGGFRFVRMDFAWGGTEKTRGVYDFSGYDKLVASMARHKVGVLFILDYGNSLYENGLSPHTDEGRAAFARWAAAAAAHYAGKGIIWEIWNEPNGGFWKPVANAEDYSSLALATIAAVRQADPLAYIIGPASSGFPWDYFKVLGDRGVLALFDAVSVHPYRQSDPEGAAADYRRLRLMIDHYSPNKALPIVSGEWGYSTAWGGMTDEKQAQYLARQRLVNMAYDVPLSIWYDWHDDGTDPKDAEHHFGTVFHDYKPKPSYQAQQALSTTLDGYRYVRRLATDSPDDYLLLFRKDQPGQPAQVVLAAWTSRADAHSIAVDLPIASAANPLRIVDMLGQPVTTPLQPARIAGSVAAGRNRLEVPLGPSPIYLLLPTSLQTAAVASWQPASVFSAVRPGGATVAMQVTNPGRAANPTRLAVEVGGQQAALMTVTSPPGQPATLTVTLPYYRRDRDHQVVTVYRIEGGGGHSVLDSAQTELLVPNLVHLTVLPPLQGQATVMVDNTSGEPLRANLRLKAGNTSVPATLNLAADQTNALATVPLPANFTGPLSVEGTDEQGRLILQTEPSNWRAAVALTPGQEGWRAWTEGDPVIAATAAAKVVPVPQPPPQAGLTAALEVDYRFANGWRYAPIAPPAAQSKIEGQPSALGMWVYGDGSGNSLRARYVDSTGQTFQPSFGDITWTGWRFVTMALGPENLGHWGGANDGVVHYPITWNAIALIDNLKHKVAQDLKIYLTGFALQYPAGK